jgi:hypothetical protein
MTPLTIEILLHCYYSPEVHPRRDAPAVAEAFLLLLQSGLIERCPDETSDDRCRTTARGVAHVAQLCCLAWPTAGWVGADGKLICDASGRPA